MIKKSVSANISLYRYDIGENTCYRYQLENIVSFYIGNGICLIQTDHIGIVISMVVSVESYKIVVPS